MTSKTLDEVTGLNVPNTDHAILTTSSDEPQHPRASLLREFLHGLHNISMRSSAEQKQPLSSVSPALVCRAAALFTISSPVTGINATPMKTDIFRALNITSVPDNGEQTEDLLISSHDVAVR